MACRCLEFQSSCCHSWQIPIELAGLRRFFVEAGKRRDSKGRSHNNGTGIPNRGAALISDDLLGSKTFIQEGDQDEEDSQAVSHLNVLHSNAGHPAILGQLFPSLAIPVHSKDTNSSFVAEDSTMTEIFGAQAAKFAAFYLQTPLTDVLLKKNRFVIAI